MKAKFVKIHKMRVRWRRWLGQKTRVDKPYYVILLESNWAGWVYGVIAAHSKNYERLKITSSIAEIKALYLRAINIADYEELIDLDSRFANERLEKLSRR